MISSSDHPSDARLFIDECRRDSETMHALLERLLAGLDAPHVRPEAAKLLHQLATRSAALTANGQDAPFTVAELALPGRTFRLLQLPSVFLPERWSFTFYEGLSRMPAAEFEGRRVAELGVGNGWVSLALAQFRQPHRVYGLDINPRAVLSARLNLHLNASRPDGSLITDKAGRSLLDRVEFHVSDVLTWCRQRGLALDRVVGCIPQVLDPTLVATESAAAESGSDAFLYALSNYCGTQGFVEDQFGLGLMARVLEEAIEVLSPGGKVVFNLGGRPGQAVLRRLFERRGYRVTEIWRTRAPQAKDTEIGALVEIEDRTAHRFEFFLGPQSEEAVGARTAAAFAAAGGSIFHSINVFQGELDHAAHVQRLFSVLSQPAFADAHEAIDLAFGDQRIAEEKLSFLAELAAWLEHPRAFPYGDTAGVDDFRARFVAYLAGYFDAPLSPEAIFVAPTRAAALIALFLCHRPSRALIDRELAALLSGQQGTPAATGWGKAEVLEAPRSLELCGKLLETLRPGLLVVALTTPESQSLDALRHLIDTAHHTGTALVFDISAGFELSSEPAQHPALRLLAERALPEHVTLLCGLVKGDVYRDLELSLLISENQAVLTCLRSIAELTYSRSPLLVQRYYSRILADLLSFRIQDSQRPARLPRAPQVGPAGAAEDEHPSLRSASLERPEGTLRLDYGENTLPAPTCVRSALLEAFARRELDASELDVRPELRALLARRFGLHDVELERLHLGGGIAPLFSSLMVACASERASLLLPSGAYGYFAGSARLAGAEVRAVETSQRRGFKLTPTELGAALAAEERPAWLYLNAPIVNPTGALYSADEVFELLRLASDAGATVVLDTVFAGLEGPGVAGGHPLLLQRVPPRAKLVVLGGLSKELAAGGLRFGYGYATTSALSKALAGGRVFGAPHATLRFAVKRIFQELDPPTPATARELQEQRMILAERAEQLCDALSECGWEPLRPEGGLFVAARPSAYLGRRIELSTAQGSREYRLEGESLVEALLAATGLLINGPRFTGIPEYYRFVLPVEADVFDRALTALRDFHRLASEAE